MADSAPPAVKAANGQPAAGRAENATDQTSDGKAAAKGSKRPEKPDEEKFKAAVAKAEKEHAAAQEDLNAIKNKLNGVKPGDRESPVAKRREELRAQLAEIRQQQSGFKATRGNHQERIAALDAQLKSRLAEQKAARGRVPFKNVDEVDREIQRLEKMVDAGTMKLVDEKKALAEVSSLRKQRKTFGQFDEAQKGIEAVKDQISEIRKGMDNPEAKALGDKYTAIQKELDQIKAEQDDVYKNLNVLRDERTKLSEIQRAKWEALKALRDEFHTARIAAKNYEQEQKRQRAEKMRAENEAYQREKRQRTAQEKLEQASEAAYMNEIRTAEGLIRYFDPSTPVEAKALRGPSGFAAEAQRSIDASDIKGVKVSKKEDRDEAYFMGSGGKKGKKGKKGAATTPTLSSSAEGKFNLSIGVIEELGKINIEPPMTQADVPNVIEKLKAKVTHWKGDQEKKTKENIARAQAEIDKLETEANAADNSIPASKSHDSAKKPTLANAGINGTASASGSGSGSASATVAAELAQEKDAEADVAEELKKASIEDAE